MLALLANPWFAFLLSLPSLVHTAAVDFAPNFPNAHGGIEHVDAIAQQVGSIAHIAAAAAGLDPDSDPHVKLVKASIAGLAQTMTTAQKLVGDFSDQQAQGAGA